jgi:mono/diheme cytochrome c family protein
MIERLTLAGAALAAALCAPTDAMAQAFSPAEQRGQTFVSMHCAACHSIAKVGPSPIREAPPFRILHTRYPVESLQEALAEGITTGHPSMPQFRLDPGQIQDVLSYLKSLER